MKKTLIALILAVTFVLTFTLCVSAAETNETETATEVDIILGDVNGDGIITNADVLKIYRYIYSPELYPLDTALADVNSDDMITNADVLKIYRYIYNPVLYPLATLPSSITLSHSAVKLKMGGSVTVTASILPQNSTNKTVTWTTSNPGVATVSGGIISAVGEGTATITATTSNGKTATCQVSVITNGLIFKTLTVTDAEIYGKVSNSATTFSFLNEVQAVGNAKYEVCRDIECTEVIRSKTASLNVGDNTFYILEYINDDVNALYIVTIRRRPMYTVSFDTLGGTSVSSQTVEEEGYAFSPTSEKLGCNFAGWTPDISVPITGNTTFTAVWTTTPYKVEHYIETLDGSYELKDTNNFSGGDNESVTPRTKSYTGFTSPEKQTVSINPDGSTVVKYYYTRNSYTVTFVTNGGEDMSPITLKYQQPVSLEKATRTGYTFNGWFANSALSSNLDATMPAKNIMVYAAWIANTDTAYKVEHYVEMLDGSYELKDTDYLTGTTDSKVTPNTKRYTGLYSPSKTTATVLPDSSAVIKYYYKRISYTVTFVTNGGEAIKSQSIKYEGSLPAATRMGYTFGGWFDNVELTNKIDTMPAKNITVYAYWSEENKPGDFTYSGTSAITIDKYAATDTTVVIPCYVGGVKVTSIGNSAFDSCTSLKSITIPDSVTSIGYNTFYGCTSLESITIPFVGATKNGTSNTHFGYIFGVSDYSYNRNVPASLKTVVVTGGDSIDNRAFYDCTSLTSITIPDSVTSIGERAFLSCTSLASVTIGDSVTSIGDYAFFYCTSLTSVTIPDSVTSIGDDAFNNCTSLTSVTIGNSVTSIDSSAFEDCTSLTSITIPDSVTSIGDNAFYKCTSLTSVTIPDSVTSIGYSAFWGCTSLKDVYISDIEAWLNISFSGSLSNPCYDLYLNGELLTSVDLPDSITQIGYAFCGCTSLESVIIPDSVTSIGYGAFRYCTSLASVTIGDSVTSIGSSAFEDCTSLTSITIPDSVTSIGEDAFYNCTSLKDVYITDIEAWLNISFGDYSSHPNYYGNIHILDKEGNEITEVIIPDSISKIGDYAFSGCTSLKSITIPDSVTSIGDDAFEGCTSLKSITIPDSVTSIGDDAFYNCTSLTSIEIPDSVTNIGDWAFYYCYKLIEVINKSSLSITAGSSSNGYVAYYAKEVHDGSSKIVDKDGFLFYTYNNVNYLVGYKGNETEIILPDNYNGEKYEIYKYAFYKCTSLTSIEILDSVTSIGSSAFYGCTSLTSVTIGDSVTSIGNYAFSSCSSLESITVQEGNAKYHSEGNCLIETESGTLMVGLKNSIIPSDGSVTSIGSYAFYKCTSLTSVTIPDSVTSIGYSAFYDCISLTSVTIPDSVTSIGYSAFYDCISLTSITIPDSVTSIGDDAFYYCTSLASVTIGDSVTSIGDWAFFYCTSLTSITIPDSVTSMGHYAFYNCTSLASVTIGDSVTSIGNDAFRYCTSLTSITIPDSVTSIYSSAFNGCTSLKNVYYTGTQEQWQKISITSYGNSYLTSATIHYNYVSA